MAEQEESELQVYMKSFLCEIASETEDIIRNDAKKAQFLKSITAYREMRERFLQALQQCKNEAVENQWFYDEDADEPPMGMEKREQGWEVEKDYLIEIAKQPRAIYRSFWRPPLPFDPDTWIMRYYGSPQYNDIVAISSVPEKPKEPDNAESLICEYIVLAVINDNVRTKPQKPQCQKLCSSYDNEWAERLWDSIYWCRSIVDNNTYDSRTHNINESLKNVKADFDKESAETRREGVAQVIGNVKMTNKKKAEILRKITHELSVWKESGPEGSEHSIEARKSAEEAMEILRASADLLHDCKEAYGVKYRQSESSLKSLNGILDHMRINDEAPEYISERIGYYDYQDFAQEAFIDQLNHWAKKLEAKHHGEIVDIPPEKSEEAEQEGKIEAKPPVIIQNIEWFRINGRKYWKHLVIAIVIISSWWLIPKVISIWGEANRVSDEASIMNEKSRDTLTQDSGQQTVVNNEGDGNISFTYSQGVNPKEFGEVNKKLGKTEQELKQAENKNQELEQVVNAYRSEDKEKRAILMRAENEEKIKLHVKVFQEQKKGNISEEELSKLCDLVNKALWEDLKSFIEDKNIKIDEHNQSLVSSGIFKSEVTGGGYRARYNPAKMVYVLTPEGNTLYEIATTKED